MAGKGKKMAAALAAVSLYLDDEAMAGEQSKPLVGSRLTEASQWGQSGRQEMMAMRRLVQMRTFTRI